MLTVERYSASTRAMTAVHRQLSCPRIVKDTMVCAFAPALSARTLFHRMNPGTNERYSIPKRARPRTHRYTLMRRVSVTSAAVSASNNARENEASPEFIRLCEEQLDLLRTTIPSVNALIFFARRENASTGEHEFVPLVAEPRDATLWISGTTTTRRTRSRTLTGGIPAKQILPEYPLLLQKHAEEGIVSPDGTLCVPVVLSTALSGCLTLSRHPSIPPSSPWEDDDRARVRAVARTIALATVMEGKWMAADEQVRRDKVVRESLREILRSALHQIKSPVTALITFGHLLLHQLPPSDENRRLAKNVIVASYRVNDLLSPLDVATAEFRLPVSDRNDMPRADQESGRVKNASEQAKSSSDSARLPVPTNLEIKLVWVPNVLADVVDSSSILAEAKGVRFFSELEEDTPPVHGNEQALREAVDNCVDNSLKYCTPGSVMGLRCGLSQDSRVVEVEVWDAGPGIPSTEHERVWESGYRGAIARAVGPRGSGLGLPIAKSFVEMHGGQVELASPLPGTVRERLDSASDSSMIGPGTSIRFLLPRAQLGHPSLL